MFARYKGTFMEECIDVYSWTWDDIIIHIFSRKSANVRFFIFVITLESSWIAYIHLNIYKQS